MGVLTCEGAVLASSIVHTDELRLRCALPTVGLQHVDVEPF